MKRVALLGALAALSTCGSCWDPAQRNGTALYLTLTFDSPIDQVEVTVPAAKMDPVVEPMTAAGPLVSPATMRVLLPDSLDGEMVAVHVVGSSVGTAVSEGDGSAMVRKGFEVDVAVTLVAGCGPATCMGCCNAGSCVGGKDSAACGSGGNDCTPCDGSCDAGVCSSCNATSCPTGCCSGSACITASLSQCGKGSACLTCDGAKADRCEEGLCRCGAHDTCGLGLRCVNAQCVCDATSCPDGCCDASGACVGRDDTHCGVGGAHCRDCTSGGKTDVCSDTGTCQCGAREACASGQSCIGGQCACDDHSCSGCCDGAQCLPSAFGTCGSTGSTCVVCTMENADKCVSGGCMCGALPPCGSGERCVGDTCVCDPQSCPDGCCDSAGKCVRGSNDASKCGSGGAACGACPGSQSCANGVCSGCNPGNCGTCCSGASCAQPSLTTCGNGGTACLACNAQRANGCDGGQCVCGAGAACAVGQVCDAGACTCDPSSCDGCCQGNVCLSGLDAGACGAGGLSCAACAAPRADTCALGSCHCGPNAPCTAGLRCVAGACVCDAQSGCSGCCEGNTCHAAGTTTATTCGADGGMCGVCNTTKADNCNGGGCHCGSGAPCGPGLICSGSQCVCNTSSGCGGCCQNGTTCVENTSQNACGNGGSACVACGNSGNNCNGGTCHCGLAGACGPHAACAATLCL